MLCRKWIVRSKIGNMESSLEAVTTAQLYWSELSRETEPIIYIYISGDIIQRPESWRGNGSTGKCRSQFESEGLRTRITECRED